MTPDSKSPSADASPAPDGGEVVAPDDPILWMSTRALERIWDGHQTGASSYQIANGKFDKFINPLVLKSALDAANARADAAEWDRDAFVIRGNEAAGRLAKANTKVVVMTDRAEAAERDYRTAQDELGRAYTKVGELAVEKGIAEGKLADALEVPQNEVLAHIHKRRADDLVDKLARLLALLQPFVALASAPTDIVSINTEHCRAVRDFVEEVGK